MDGEAVEEPEELAERIREKSKILKT